ncbi:tRNA-uridine aminocarboxypropyltransferase [Oceaniserpentilla sp. 4NH20-0058]|uniref:tRNA-uridine aminocarboxypropyltransferase n=1 Tax=Oceaniserpentilla sp. 4NH20-0058 TaxID=3127660 RepID=UPI003101FAA8
MFDPNAPRKPYLAKGSNVKRCTKCKMAQDYCLCADQTPIFLTQKGSVQFCLLMHKEESYKPSNTGRLIEHILPENTHRFYWNRTEPDPKFIQLINHSDYQPYIIFPGDRGGYDDRVVEKADLNTGKAPLFIILDGSWRQAGRMFRLSQYLQTLPVLPLTSQRHSSYKLRKAPDEFHLCTVEVAIELLMQHEQEGAGRALEAYFQRFNHLYALSRRQQKIPKD